MKNSQGAGLHGRAGAVGVGILGAAFQLLGIAAQDRTQPAFQARADVVQIDVRVVDGRGRFVEGLTRADFVVTDDNGIQEISQFRQVSIDSGNRPVEAKRDAAVRDVFANDEPPTPRALVVFIDSFHLTTDAETLVRVRRVLTDALRELTDTDDVAIIFADRSDLSIAFTRDLALQMGAIDHIRDALRPVSRGAERARLANLKSSFWTLKNVCDFLAGTAHTRKAVLYVGEGLAVDLAAGANREHLAIVQEATRAAIRAGVVLYAIDPRGLLTAYGQEDAAAQRQQRNFLSALTLDSGGRVIAGSANVTEGIKEIVRDNGHFYVLGYTPTPFPRDGKLHAIGVSVRNPAWTVVARRGYVASPAERAGDDTIDPLSSALTRSFPVSDVALRAVAAPDAPAANGLVQTQFTIEIGGDTTEDQDWEVAVVALTPDAKPVASGRQRVRLGLGRTDSKAGLVHATLDVPPGLHAIRLGVRSLSTGALGTVHLAIDVPNLSDDRLAAGGVSFEWTKTGLDARAVKTADRKFSAVALPTISVPFFWRASDGERLEVVATVRVKGRVVSEERQGIDGAFDEERRSARFKWDLQPRALPPGAYELEVIGHVGRRSVNRIVPFRVRD